jgi:hypothetical protein
MTIFDRERQKRANEMKKQAEDTARDIARLAKQRQDNDARRKQESISQQYWEQSPFPELLEELKRYLDRPRRGFSASLRPLSRQQFSNPSHEDYGAVGLSLVETRTMFIPDTTSLFANKPRSFKQVKWIEVFALPNGTIKVEGGPLGKTVLFLDQWRDPSPGLSQQDIAERAIDKAWKHSHVRSKDFRERKDWDTEDITLWNSRSWWRKLFPGWVVSIIVR